MFDNPYPFRYKHKEPFTEGEYKCTRHVFTFFCKNKQKYVAHLEEYPYEVYIIKFYRQAHHNSDRKFNLLTNGHDASRKIATCLEIMIYWYLNHNPFASFGFIGANLDGEKKNNTKRFRIYQRLMENVFSTTKFNHYDFPSSSFYLMLNRDNRNNSDPDILKKIEKVMVDIYDFDGFL